MSFDRITRPIVNSMAPQPKALVLSGMGLNCENESQHAFEQAGAKVDQVHVNELIENPERLKDYQILMFPGGFSYGDHTGSGKALANDIKHANGGKLFNAIKDFIAQNKLVMGVCNGFQVLTGLELLPGALSFNKVEGKEHQNGRFLNKWVELKVNPGGKGPWFKENWPKVMQSLHIPIAHGEGRFVADANSVPNDQIALKYLDNPNGSMASIAGVTNESGNVLGMMPHPERALYHTNHPYWTTIVNLAKRAERNILKLPARVFAKLNADKGILATIGSILRKSKPGETFFTRNIHIFDNAVNHIKEKWVNDKVRSDLVDGGAWSFP